MNTDLRTAGVSDTDRADLAHGRMLKLMLSLAVLATTGCGDMTAPAASANERQQPYVSAGESRQTEAAAVSQAGAGPPAGERAPGADEFVLDDVELSSKNQTRVVFLHGLHSPFGMALAMSRIPTPR